MRLLHTGDWHLGHKLFELHRSAEHDAFLDWLICTLHDTQADALLIAGDVFDRAHPSAAAQRQWFGFLARAAAELPHLQIVVIGGNHDSPTRLDAPAEVLRSLRVHVVGGMPRTSQGTPAVDDLLVPLHHADGAIGAWVCAVPFLRAGDLAPPPDAEDPIVEGVAAIYAQVVEAAQARQQPGQALIGMGHAHLHGASISELSERRVLVGNQGALPTSIFPSALSYVALGHLHRAQQVGAPHIRYAGSPIPLSVPERHYPHQVLQVDLLPGKPAEVTPLPVPRSVEVLRIPEQDAAPLDEVLAAIRQLPEGDPQAEDTAWWPMLQVSVALSGPDPTVRTQVEDALHGRRVRLVYLQSVNTGTGEALADAPEFHDLRSMDPEQVFLRRWASRHQDPVDPKVLRAFHELLQHTQDEVAS